MMSQCVLAKVLAERGHEVVSFGNAEQAVLAYEKDFFPLAFVDADLPGMDGLQFCRWLRSQPTGDQVFIMMATSPGHPANMQEVLAAGANDFLPKPYDMGSLDLRLSIAQNEMENFFSQRNLENELHAREEETTILQKALDVESCRFKEREKELSELHESLAQRVEDLQNQSASLQEELETERAARVQAEEERDLRAAEVSQGGASGIEPTADEAKRQEETAGLQAKIAEMERTLNEREEALSALQNERAELKSEALNLREQVNRSSHAHQSQLEELQERLIEKDTARGRLSEEMAKTREELAAKANDYTAAVLKAGQEVDDLIRHRREWHAELEKCRREFEEQIKAREQELDEAKAQLRRETTERTELESALQDAWNELQAQKSSRPEAVAGDRGGQAGEAERDRLQGALEAEQARCEQLERALRAAKSDFQNRLRHFAATIDSGSDAETDSEPLIASTRET